MREFKPLLDWVSGVLCSEKASCLFFFALGVLLRGIPELLISYYPVGYETITYYAPVMMSFNGKGLVDVFLETFRAGPLFYVLMWVSANLSGAHAFFLLKVAGPVLYGFLAVTFFVFVRYGLRLEWKMAFVATLILVFQPVALRESWDRFRTVLALAFLFVTLTVLRGDWKFRWLLVSVLGVLTVLSREYVGAILFVAVLGFAILERRSRVKSLVALGPSIAIFVAISYPSWIWWNYLSLDNPFAVGSYLWMVQDVFAIFAVCYLPLLPFIIRGFQRDRLLDPIVGWLLLGSFSVVFFPWFAVPGYQRWLMLLVFPFAVYAVKGFRRLRLFCGARTQVLRVIILVFVVIGAGYSTGAFSYIGAVPNSYVAVNLVQSSIAWNQVDDVKGVLLWFDDNVEANSSVLTEERFYGWTLIYLKRAKEDVEVVPYGANSPLLWALEKVAEDGSDLVYLIWYTDTRLENFRRVYSLNGVSIFQYELDGVDFFPLDASHPISCRIEGGL